LRKASAGDAKGVTRADQDDGRIGHTFEKARASRHRHGGAVVATHRVDRNGNGH